MHYHYIPAPTPTPPPTPQPTTIPTAPVTPTRRGPAFVIGACQQPVENFPKLKALGINTLVDIPSGRDPLVWRAAVQKAGFNRISPIIGTAEEDAKDPLLLAWSHLDEPDLKGTPLATIKAARDATKALGIPWFLNVDGSRLLGIQAPAAGTDYQGLADNSDWLCSDIYPKAGWNGNVSLWTPGQASDKLIELGKGKPVLSYIECSKQIQWPQASVAEMLLILRQATSRNLRGVIFFPFNFNIGWDNAFFDVDAEHCEAMAEWAEKQNT